MKTFNFIKQCTAVCLTLGLFLLQGCEKSETAADNDGNTTVLVKVVGSKTNEASTTLPQVKAFDVDIKSDNAENAQVQITAESSVENGFISSQSNLISSSKRSTATGLEAATNAEKGAKYRLMLYYKDSGKFYKSMMMNADELAKLELPSYNTFTWVAYSHNENKDIAVPSDVQNPKLTSSINKPLLYSSGEIEVEGGQVTLDIQFKYLQAQVVVELNATQMYGKLVSVKAKFDKTDYIKTGTLNLRTGKMENVQSANISDLTFYDDVDGATKYASYYTIEPERLTQIGVIFSEIQVKLDESGEIRSGLTNAGVAQLVKFPFTNPGAS